MRAVLEAIIITVFYIENGFIAKCELSPGDAIPKRALWVDLVEPTAQEELYIENAFKIEAPNREEQDKIEVMSPFYREGDAYFMTITALFKPDIDHPESSPISFILTPDCLVTVRHVKPRSFTNFAALILRKK